MTTQYHAVPNSARGIAETLERAIDAGRYAGGDTLPTIRALAAELGASPTTVNAAFAILRARGRIVGKRRGGSIVVAPIALQSASEHAAMPGRNLAVANPDPAFLPALAPIVARIAGERRLYTDIRDNDELLARARVSMLAEGVDATHLGIASGAMDAIERGLMAMTAPGDTIAVEDPGYPPYRVLARALGLEVVSLTLDAHGVTPDALRNALKARAKAIVVVPRAQNPTGASFDVARAKELASILDTAPEVGVVEDDYLALVCGVELQSLARGRTRFLHVRSLAKTIGPDIRVAPFAADELTLSRLIARQRIGCGWVSNLLQDTALALVSSPATTRLTRAATRAYDRRRERFLVACRREGLDALGHSGLTVWVRVPDESAAVRAALAAGFSVDGGARYRVLAPPAVRVTTTTITPTESDVLAHALAHAGSHLP